MKLDKIQMVTLSQAWLCRSCEAVSNCSGSCPNCGEQAVDNLKKLLNRTMENADESIESLERAFGLDPQQRNGCLIF